MDRSGEHYIKWNKPGGERQIPYDLTDNWNLINKTNKQAKYNQRHWNKEQIDTSTLKAKTLFLSSTYSYAILERSQESIKELHLCKTKNFSYLTEYYKK